MTVSRAATSVAIRRESALAACGYRVVLSEGLHKGFKHPHGEAVTAYEAAVGGDDRVYCTNRHGTVTIYGFPDGRIRVTRQRVTYKSCGFDGTLY